MRKLKDKLGGTYTKENGRWFWSKGKEKHLVTTGWLIRKLEQPKVESKAENKAEVKSEVKVEAKPVRKATVVFGETKPKEEKVEEKANEPKSTE